MDRNDFFSGQFLTEDEMDAAFDKAERADWNISKDNSLVGIIRGLTVEQSATPDLNVTVKAGEAYDKNGKRIVVPSDVVVDVSVDSNGVSTTVSSDGNARVVSIFIEPERQLSNPRTDDTSATIQYNRDEFYKITKVQSSEVTNPPAHSDYPALDPNKILLADIVRTFGDTAIKTADIRMNTRPSPSVLGREDQVSLNPQPAAASGLTPAERSIRRNKVIAQPSTGKPYADCGLGDMLQYHNEHIRGTASQHNAAHINVAAGTFSAGMTVQARFDEIQATTNGASGARRLGSEAYTPTPGPFTGLSSGHIFQQLQALANGLAGSTQAANVSYAGSGNWADGNSISAKAVGQGVEAAIDQVVSDLAASTGADKIGAAARTNFSGASIGAQLASIDTSAVWLAGTQTITGAKTFSANPTIASGVALLPGSITSSIGNASNNFGSVYTTQVARANTSQSVQFDTDTNKNVWITTRNAAGSAQIIVLTVNPTATVLDSGSFQPKTDDLSDIGSPTKRWRTLHAVDGYRMIIQTTDLNGYTGGFGDSAGIVFPRAGEILAVSMMVFTPSPSGTITATARVNTTDSSVAVTYPGGGSGVQRVFSTPRKYKDGTGTGVSFAAGDHVLIRYTSTGTIVSTSVKFFIEVAT